MTMRYSNPLGEAQDAHIDFFQLVASRSIRAKVSPSNLDYFIHAADVLIDPPGAPEAIQRLDADRLQDQQSCLMPPRTG